MLALVIFLNGMCIMVLEMVGARLLAPWLGTSIVVWTSLIGVILACLSAGYWLGGRLADSYMREGKSAGSDGAREKKKKSGESGSQSGLARAHKVLSLVLFFAAVSVGVTAMLQSVLLPALSGVLGSLHLEAVCAALLLFAVPSVLCGMVSPYAIRLAITSRETSGAVIGRLNAVGTVGSIVGTFLGGFVLISWFGSVETTLGVAITLLAASALVCLKPWPAKAALGLCLLLSVAGVKSYGAYQNEQGSTTVESSYSTMRIAKGNMEGREVRLLLTDPGSAQSAQFLDDPAELTFAYTRFYELATSMKPDASRILMLGGGGYSIPKWLLAGRSGIASDFHLDVVEIDPVMTEVAQKYFDAPIDDARMRIFHEDARTFINRAAASTSRADTAEAQGGEGKYDLIFADIFNSWYTVPFHVGTREAAANIGKLLTPDGVFIMNIITAITGDNGRLLRSIRNAFMEEFGEVHIFPVHARHNGEMVQNVMLMAFRDKRSLPDSSNTDLPPNVRLMLAHRWSSPFPDAALDVPALHDDFAPVERYTLGFKP